MNNKQYIAIVIILITIFTFILWFSNSLGKTSTEQRNYNNYCKNTLGDADAYAKLDKENNEFECCMLFDVSTNTSDLTIKKEGCLEKSQMFNTNGN